MRRLTMSALLAFALTWSAGASASGGPAAESDAAPQSVDRYALEQRVLQLMVEEQALRRRRESFRAAVEEEIDPETQRRFFDGGDSHTGIYVHQRSMQVYHVVPGSPGYAAGLRENDRVVEINDTVGGDGPDAGARLLWAFRRMNLGDLVSVTFLRGEERQTVQVPVISRSELQRIQSDARGDAESSSESDMLERARAYEIHRRQRSGVRSALGEDRFSVWDGLLLMSVAGGLSEHLATQIGVLVLESEDSDHPLRAGDVIAHVGHNRPSDARHAVELLYDYEDQPLIPLMVERDGVWLELELPYPASERIGDVLVARAPDWVLD